MAYLDDGYSTTIEFGQAPNIRLREKSVTPPPLEGGDAIEVTTMRNNVVRTFHPQSLANLGELSFVASYDPIDYFDIYNILLNENDLITLNFPDGSRITFYGYLKSFSPNEHNIGEQPTANVVIQPTNRDPARIESPPVYFPPP